MRKNDLRLITDKDLIVFLVASGIEIRSIEKDPVYQRSNVYFDNTEKLNAAILNYTNKSTVVNIADYMAAEKRVKTLLCMQKSS
ncbi:MAG: DUF5659 domain-containing protein [Caulobacteraceae bacterium]